MTSREQIAEQVLALPVEDRTYFADVLEQSLSNGEFATPEIATEWAAEINQRIEAYERGDVQVIDEQTAIEHIRTRLAEI